MVIDFKAKALIPQDVMFRELDGETVLLDAKGLNYFGLDETASRIWHAAVNSESINEAVIKLLEEFEVSEEQLRRDMEKLLGEMVKKDLVEISPI